MGDLCPEWIWDLTYVPYDEREGAMSKTSHMHILHLKAPFEALSVAEPTRPDGRAKGSSDSL